MKNMEKKLLKEIPIDSSIEEFDAVDEAKEITGIFCYGRNADRDAACQDANDLAKKLAKKKGTCFKKAKPEDCTMEQPGIFTARAAVANHAGSCTGKRDEWSISI